MSNLLTIDNGDNQGASPFVDVIPSKELNVSSYQETLEYTSKQFLDAYEHTPQYVTRAPGRVNIIGEHIDYNGFGVLPMALEQSTYAAYSSTPLSVDKDKVHLQLRSSCSGAKPCRYCYDIKKLISSNHNANNSESPFNTSSRDWSHYVLCAFFGVCETLHSCHITRTNSTNWTDGIKGKTLSLFIHGTVPQGAGVSSSSALVVASALAFLTLLGQIDSITKTEIATLCARCERWVGTEGGGMDQAISLFAQAGSGRYIQFQPTFQHMAIPLPTDGSWVVCHSLEESHKRHDAATLFNKRVIECKVGCRLLAQALNWEDHHLDGYPKSLWELVSKSGMSLEELEKLTNKNIVQECSKEELISRLVGGASHDGSPIEQLAKQLGIVRVAGVEVLQVAESFCIRNRLLHVFSETRRVQEFVAHCCYDDKSPPTVTEKGHATTKGFLHVLGDLMNHSHTSCSQLYDCSSSQVDRLQQACLEAPGTVGSRMTGAGWGGCVISLVRSQHVEKFCAHVQTHYYDKLHSPDKSTQLDKSDYMFVTKPSQGSNIIDCRTQSE